jgi:hypothetical protein
MSKLHLTYVFENEDELRAHLGGEVRSGTETVDEETGEVNTVDSDGFPYDAELHAESRAVNADGRWKVKRGKAEAEANARAAFKAAGATTTEVEAPAAAMPVEAAAPVIPGMPAAAVERAPIALDALIARLQSGMGSGKIGASGTPLADLYGRAGSPDPNAYATNETLRAALWAELDKIGV